MTESSEPFRAPVGGPAPTPPGGSAPTPPWGSAPTPPPPPEWVLPTLPWSAYTSPTSSTASAWDPFASSPPTADYETWPPAAAPLAPPPPPPPPKRNRSGVAFAVAAALISAFIGVGIGSRLHTANVSSTPVATPPLTASTPSTTPSTTPGAGTDPTTPSTGPSSGSAAGPGATGSPPTSAQASAIAAKVDAGIVDINTRLGYQNGAGAGTGIILTSSGEVLTNNHVIEGATSIRVTLVATGRTYTAKVVGTDPTEDIAVIQLQGVSGLSPIPIGDSSAVSQGDPVVAIGNAGGVGGTPSAVTGTVQALNQSITASDGNGANAERLTGLIQINAPIQPGDSGGPLVNAAAQVIGIDTAASTGSRFEAAATVGFAIPIAHAVSIAQQIESGHATATIHIGLPGFLGVSVLPAGSGASTKGAVVAGVESGTPAEAAGLVVGDTITSFNGQTVDSAQTLTTLTRSHRPGDRVTIGWTDQSGAGHTAKVTLAVGPAD